MDDEYASHVIGNLSEEMEAHMRRMESVVVTGQRMANLLYWFEKNFRGFDDTTDPKCNEAKELVARWEKEFPKKETCRICGEGISVNWRDGNPICYCPNCGEKECN